MADPVLNVQPKVWYPREARVGERYLLEIELEAASDAPWAFDEEELVVHCMVRTQPLFSSMPLNGGAVVLHRFGGSYGRARFLLTASKHPASGSILITLVNPNGVPLGKIVLKDVRVGVDVPLPVPTTLRPGESAGIPPTLDELLQARRFDEALERARGLSLAAERVGALQRIAVAMGTANDPRAFIVAQEASREMRDIHDQQQRVRSQRDNAVALAQLERFEDAFVALAEIGDATAESEALTQVTEILGQMAASGRVDEALAVAREVPRASNRAAALRTIALRLWPVNSVRSLAIFGEAATAVRAIEDGFQRAEAGRRLAVALADTGNFTDALSIASEISDDFPRGQALIEIASSLARAGHFDEAVQTAGSITNAAQKAEAYIRIAVTLSRVKDPRTYEQFRAAVDAADAIQDTRRRDGVLSELALAHAEAGYVGGAEVAASKIADSSRRSEALRLVEEALARQGLSTAAAASIAPNDDAPVGEQVYLSFSPGDAEMAERLVARLRDAGYAVVMDRPSDPEAPSSGSLRTSRALVVLISTDSFSHEALRLNLLEAQQNKIPILPMIVNASYNDSLNLLPMLDLDEVQAITNLAQDFDSAFDLLLRGLRFWVDEGRTEVPVPSSGYDVYISYSHMDREIVARVHDALVANGISVWWDADLLPGMNWRQVIEQAEANARGVVAMRSPDAAQSIWVRRDIDRALTLSKPLFPVLLRGSASEVITGRLASFQYIDMADFERGIAELVRGIRERLSISPTPPPRPNRIITTAPVYAAPFVNAPVVAALPDATALEVRGGHVEGTGEQFVTVAWTHIRSSEPPVTGWVASILVSDLDKAGQRRISIEPTTLVAPNFDARPAGTLSPGAEVQVTGTSEDGAWVNVVPANQAPQWLSVAFLENRPKPDVIVDKNLERPLNLRVAPVNGAVIRQLTPGWPMQILSWDDTREWLRVLPLGGPEGFVKAEFVTDAAGNRLIDMLQRWQTEADEPSAKGGSPLRYAAYIRNLLLTQNDLSKQALAANLIGALRQRVEMQLAGQVYFFVSEDTRVVGAYDERRVAESLCQSACLIVLAAGNPAGERWLLPAREMLAMTQLAQEREPDVDPRDSVYVFALDRAARAGLNWGQSWDITDEVAGKPSVQYEAQLAEIAGQIVRTVERLRVAGPDESVRCEDFSLPGEADARNWLAQQGPP